MCANVPADLAPEMVACEGYGFKADIWAAGCVLYEMAALKPAFRVSATSCVQLHALIFCNLVLGPELPVMDGWTLINAAYETRRYARKHAWAGQARTTHLTIRTSAMFASFSVCICPWANQ